MSIITITKDNRCYNEINSLLIVVASLSIALEYRMNGMANYQPGDSAVLEGLSTAKMLWIPVHGPVEAIIHKLKPGRIEITVTDLQPSSPIYEVSSRALQETLNYMFTPYFVSFYESNYNDAERKFGKNYEAWPASWRMGWAIRNAFAHNKRVYFKKLNIAPIEWQGVVISPANQDKPIEAIFSSADLILLLFEMESDLA